MTFTFNELTGNKTEATQPASSDLTAGLDSNIASLSLTSLAQPEKSSPGGGGGTTKKGGSVIGSFLSGFGSEAMGTVTSLLGQSQEQMTKNEMAGGSGGGTGGGAGLLTENVVSGVAKTANLAIHNPGAFAAIPGQLYTQFKNGDAQTRSNMIGHATFFGLTLLAGGGGASKATKIAGDVREATAATKVVDVVGDLGSTASRLETSTAGLGAGAESITNAGRASELLTKSSRIDGLATSAENASSVAARLDGLSGAVENATSRIPGAVGWSERVLPAQGLGAARTAATDFLSSGSEGLGRAGSLDVGSGATTSLTTRFLQGAKSLGQNGLDNMSTRISGLTSRASELGTTISNKLPSFTSRFVRGSEDGVLDAARATTEGGSETAVNEAARGTTALPNSAESLAGRIGTGSESTVNALTHGTTSVLPQLEAGVSRATTELPGLVVEHTAQAGSELTSTLPEGVARLTGEGAGTATADLGRAASELPGLAGNTARIATDVSAAPGMFGSLSRAFDETGATLPEALRGTAGATEGMLPALSEDATALGAKTTTLTPQLSSGVARAGEEAGLVPQLTGDAGRAVEQLADAGSETVSRTGSVAQRLETAVQSVPETVSTVDKATSALREALTAEGKAAPQSLSSVEQASTRLANATTDAERASAAGDLQRASTQLATDLPDAAPEAIKSLSDAATQAQNVERLSRLSEASTAVSEQSGAVAQNLSKLNETLAARGATAPESLTELQQASEQFAGATSEAERATQLTRMQQAGEKLAVDLPQDSADLLKSVQSLQTESANMSRLSRLDQALTAVDAQTETVTQAASRMSDALAAKGVTETSPALSDLTTATEKMTSAVDTGEKLAAYKDLQEAAARVATEYPEESVGVTKAVEALGDQVDTASQLTRAENLARTGAVSTEAVQGAGIAEGVELKSAASGSPVAEAVTERATAGSADAAENIAARTAAGSTDAAENIAARPAAGSTDAAETLAARTAAGSTDAAETLAARTGAGPADLAETLPGRGTAASAEAAEAVAGRASTVGPSLVSADTAEAAGLSEASGLRGAATFSRDAAETAGVETTVGAADSAAVTTGVRNSVAALTDDPGTLTRASTLDKSAEELAARSQAVVNQARALGTAAGAQTADASAALSSVVAKATQIANGAVGAGSVSFAGELAALQGSVAESSIANLSGALSRMQEAEGAMRQASADLVDYQGAKITQSISALQNGQLSVQDQIAQLKQLQNDLQVLRSSLPADSTARAAVESMQTQAAAADALSNILARPEVARASVKKLMELAKSSDAETARAAADRLVLANKTGNALNSPVASLVSERAKFWDAADQVTRLQKLQDARTLESGRIFGLSTSDPTFGRLAKDTALAISGLSLATGDLLYNFNKAGAMAQDIIRSREMQQKAAAEAQQWQQHAQNKSDGTDSGSTQQVPISGGGGGGGALESGNASMSNQAVFNPEKAEPAMGPALSVYGTAKYNEQAAENQFPVYGASPWSSLAAQYGGNPWGWSRGGGEAAAAEEARQTYFQQPVRRVRTDDGTIDPTKTANARFPIPGISSLTSQSALLGLSSQMANKKRRETSISTAVPRSWQTVVQWSQLGGANGRTGKYGYGGPSGLNLAGMENPGEHGVDGQGAPSGPAPNGNAGGLNDPSQMAAASVSMPNQGNDPGAQAQQV